MMSSYVLTNKKFLLSFRLSGAVQTKKRQIGVSQKKENSADWIPGWKKRNIEKSGHKKWHPQWDSNPCYQDENLMS